MGPSGVPRSRGEPAPGASAVAVDFFGRDVELDALLAALETARRGKGVLCLLAGEPGIGKTRLAAEFASRAQARGASVHWGRSWEAGGAPAYWPWIQSLRDLVDDLPAEGLADIVGADGPVLAQVLPDIGSRLGVGPASASGSPDVVRFRMFDALGRFLTRAALGRPIVLVLEDLHAADASSLLLLRFLSSVAGTRHLLVLGTYRDVELTRDHPLETVLGELLRAPGTVRIALTGLSQADAGHVIEAVSGEAPSGEMVTAIHRDTNGNPLFVGEVARLFAAEGWVWTRDVGRRTTVPEGLRGVIARRLEGLPRSCREVLTLASVFGQELVVDALERLAGPDVGSVVDCLNEAVRSQLLVPVPADPGRFRFAHALVRDALYDEIAPGERVRLHRSVGESLEGLYAADPGPHVAELAYHFLEAASTGGLRKAVDYAVAAGQRAVDLLDYEEAVRLLRMAATNMKGSPDDRLRCEVLLLLGDAEMRAGLPERSKETLLAAADIATRLDAPEALARAALTYAGRMPWLRAGIDRHIIPLLREALDAVGTQDSALRVRLLSRLAGALRDQPSMDNRVRLIQEAVPMARRIDHPETLMYALLAQWSAVLLGPDHVDEQLEVAEELSGLAELTRDRERLMDVHWPRLVAYLTRGEVWRAREELESMRRVAQELGQPAQQWYAWVVTQTLLLQDGRFAEAEDIVEDLPGRHAQPWDAAVARLFALFLLRREQGRLAELEDELRGAPVEYPGYRSIRTMFLVALCELGRHDEAQALLDQLAEADFAGFPRDNEWLFALTLLSEAAHTLEDRARAAVLYELLLPYAGLVGLAACEVSGGPVSRPLGLLAWTLGRRQAAMQHFQDALEQCGRMGARPWAARTQYAYAGTLAETDVENDHIRAVELLNLALETCEETGMTALAAEVAARLATLGARNQGRQHPPPHRSGRPSAPELTPRELEVAGLVALGSSNRQIAQQLYLSERTVETHVQNILMKFGFNSRTQIARWVLTQGTTEATT